VPEPGRRSVPHPTTHWSRRQQRRDRALESDERANLEAEEKRLEQAIDRLLDHMEAGEDVEKRLKQRRAELDALRVRLAEPEGSTWTRPASRRTWPTTPSGFAGVAR